MFDGDGALLVLAVCSAIPSISYAHWKLKYHNSTLE